MFSRSAPPGIFYVRGLPIKAHKRTSRRVHESALRGTARIHSRTGSRSCDVCCRSSPRTYVATGRKEQSDATEQDGSSKGPEEIALDLRTIPGIGQATEAELMSSSDISSTVALCKVWIEQYNLNPDEMKEFLLSFRSINSKRGEAIMSWLQEQSLDGVAKSGGNGNGNSTQKPAKAKADPAVEFQHPEPAADIQTEVGVAYRLYEEECAKWNPGTARLDLEAYGEELLYEAEARFGMRSTSHDTLLEAFFTKNPVLVKAAHTCYLENVEGGDLLVEDLVTIVELVGEGDALSSEIWWYLFFCTRPKRESENKGLAFLAQKAAPQIEIEAFAVRAAPEIDIEPLTSSPTPPAPEIDIEPWLSCAGCLDEVGA
ncbi:hypothetical protein CYMTET_49665 [Cymbomonas tetramitiformis]|uniref:Uncharacterized protein n=1 Tax=Cymbomonas tetramitiformis TaxID=36881 RepID=A0AAE0BPR9_9CHLO|nr:hypothetical protein CYMTET_49665 [Cymbomonas tetramitiformis]